MSNGEKLAWHVHEADAIQEALTGAESTGVLLAGDPGTGKHELIKSIPQMDGRHNHIVKLICSQTLSSTPYGALAPLLSVRNDSVPEVAVLRQMIVAVKNIIREHPEGDGLLLLIEEAQFIDASSAFVLGQLAHSGLSKLVVLTTEKHVDELSLETLLRGAGLMRVHLGKLGFDETRQLCSALLSGPVTLGTARIITEQTKGNLFLIRHFIEAAHRQGMLDERQGSWSLNKISPDPDIKLREAVRGFHRRHGPEEQEAMELISLAGPLPVGEVRNITGLEPLEGERVGMLRQDDDTVKMTSAFYSEVLRALIPPGKKELLRQKYREVRDSGRQLGFEELLWEMESGEAPDFATIEISMKLANDSGRHDAAWEIAQVYSKFAVTDAITIERIRALFGHEDSSATPHRLAIALMFDSETKDEGQMPNAERIARWLISDDEIDVPRGLSLKISGNDADGSNKAIRSVGAWADEALIAGIERCRQLFAMGDTEAAYEAAVGIHITSENTFIRPVCYRLALAVIGARSATTSGKYSQAQEIVDGFHFSSPGDVLHAHGSLMFCRSLNYLFQGKIFDARMASVEAVAELQIVDPEGLLDLARGVNAYLMATGSADRLDSDIRRLAKATAPNQDQDKKALVPSRQVNAEYWLGAVYLELARAEPRLWNLSASLESLKKLPHRVLEREALILCWSAVNASDMSRSSADRFLEIVEPAQSKRQEVLKQLIKLAIRKDLVELESFAARAYELDEKACAIEALARIVGFSPEGISERKLGMYLRKIDSWIEELGSIPWGYAAEMLRARGLTNREWEIVELARTGMSNKEIAKYLTVSQRTIEGHLYRIFAKLGLQTRRELLDLKPRREYK